MSAPRILIFAGSARREALSKRLLSACFRPLECAGAQLNVVDLADYPAPLYNGDLEAESGIPASMVNMQQHLAASDGLLVVSPEYNGSIPPLLKNTLDWCSRPNPADPERSGGGIFAGRPAAVLASSPGPMGGMRVLFHLRDILGYLGMYVIPQQLGVGQAGSAIGDDLRLIDPRQQAMLEAIASALTTAACKLRA